MISGQARCEESVRKYTVAQPGVGVPLYAARQVYMTVLAGAVRMVTSLMYHDDGTVASAA